MTEFEPMSPMEEALAEALEIQPFPVEQATLQARAYGVPDTLKVIAPKGEKKDTLFRVDPTENFGEFNTPHQKESAWLQHITLFGSDNGLALTPVYETGHLAEEAKKLGEYVAKVPGLEVEAVSLKAVAESIAAHRQTTQEKFIERINDYIEITEGSEYPYWVSVGSTNVQGSNLGEGYEKIHSLAKLAAIHFAENGKLHALLRKADGGIGYVEGSTQLYR